MADRPTAKREGTHHENVKHEEAYQPSGTLTSPSRNT